jgi:hypothetical protein
MYILTLQVKVTHVHVSSTRKVPEDRAAFFPDMRGRAAKGAMSAATSIKGQLPSITPTHVTRGRTGRSQSGAPSSNTLSEEGAAAAAAAAGALLALAAGAAATATATTAAAAAATADDAQRSGDSSHNSAAPTGNDGGDISSQHRQHVVLQQQYPYSGYMPSLGGDMGPPPPVAPLPGTPLELSKREAEFLQLLSELDGACAGEALQGHRVYMGHLTPQVLNGLVQGGWGDMLQSRVASSKPIWDLSDPDICEELGEEWW